MTPTSKRPVISWGLAVVLLGIVLYTVLFTYWQVLLYRGLHMGITDLGYFDQSMYNSLHGQFLQVSFDVPSPYRELQSSNSPHLFAQHPFVLMPLIVLPLYALVPHTYTLFFVQAFAAAIGALAIYLLAKDLLNDEAPAVALSFAYLLHPTLQFITTNMFTFGFHPENLFPPFFLWAFYFLHRRRWVPFWITFVPAVLVVESYTLVTAALGVYALLTPPKRRWVGIVMIALSLGWLAFSLKAIVPHFKVGGGAPWFVDDMGGGRVILESLARIPSAVIPAFAEYAARVLGPFLFLPVLGIGVAAIALPILAVNFSALLIGYGAPAAYTGWQSNPIVPVMAVAAVYGLAWLRRHVRLARHAAVAVAIVAVALACDVWYGPLPFSLDVHAGQYAVDPDRAAAIDAIRGLVPDEAVLSADYYAGSQFTRRPWLYWFPDRYASADYVLVDRASEWTTVYDQPLKYLQGSPYHEVALDQAGLLLYRRRADALPSAAHALSADFGGRIELLGYTIEPAEPHPGETLRVILYWRAKEPMTESYTVFTHLLDPDGRQVSQEDSMPMSNLHPTSEWQAGEIVADGIYELALPADAAPGEYALELGLYDGSDGKRLDVLDAMGNPKDARVVIPRHRGERTMRPGNGSRLIHAGERYWPWILLLILVVAALLRFPALDRVPPGFQFDEGYNAHDALRVLQGDRPIFLPENGGREVLYTYLQALAMALFGPNVVALRLTSAVLGLLTVAATFFLVRLMWRDQEPSSTLLGLLTATVVAVTYWHVHFSRYGIRAISLPLLEVLLFYAFWQGCCIPATGGGARRMIWWVVGGVLLGLGPYTHPAGRFLPFILGAFVVYYALSRRVWPRALLWQLLVMGAIALVMFIPLGSYFLHNPDAFSGHAGWFPSSIARPQAATPSLHSCGTCSAYLVCSRSAAMVRGTTTWRDGRCGIH